MSTSFGGEPIDIGSIQQAAVRNCIRRILPDFDVDAWLRFEHRTSDYSKYETWFRPQSLDDLPEYHHPTASDTMITVSYWPLTSTEMLTLLLEQHLNRVDAGRKYRQFGQDVKVMVYRNRWDIDITMNIPTSSIRTPNQDAYDEAIASISTELYELAHKVVGDRYQVTLNVNTAVNNPFRQKRVYMLGTGSCIECGEEGVVGRGNPATGIIATFRPYSAEAPYGKNPVYPAGKVYAHVTSKIAKKIHQTFGCRTTVIAKTRHSDPLFPPSCLLINVDDIKLDQSKLQPIIEECLFDPSYIDEIIFGRVLVPK
jgi:S-adenosylmethionine synthetase